MNISTILKYVNNFLPYLFIDIIVSVVSTYLSYSIRLESYYLPFVWSVGLDQFKSLYAYLFCILIFIPIFKIFKIYDFIPKYFDISFFSRIFYAILVYGLILFITFSITNFGIPRSLGIIQPLIFCFLICLTRMSLILRINNNEDLKKNIVLYGAGTAGFQLLNSINENEEFKVKLFIDDDPNKIGKIISGIKIISLDKIDQYIKKFNIKSLIIAIPSLNIGQKRKLIDRCKDLNIEIKTLPSLADIMDKKITIKNINDLNIGDLITREIKIDNFDNLKFKDKVIFITGAGGSIGSELCKQLVFQEPKRMILLDHSEFNLYSIKEKLENIIKLNNIEVELIFSLTSINNNYHLRKLLEPQKVDFIFHAAAYKHVELVEDNIYEALNNNFFGTVNLVKLCDELQFNNFILISSDKAVRPTSIMGSSKRLSELIIQAYSTKPETKTIFSIVRFGNVLGSSGSVINKFNDQIENENYVTVTHPEVTRFFMTVEESVNLILNASLMAKGGEIFLLDMGKPIKIIDIAKKMISLRGLELYDETTKKGDIEIKITGLKAGEKLYEELLIDGNAIISSNPNIFYGKDSHINFDELSQIENELKKILSKNDLGMIREFLKEKTLLQNNL